MTDIFGPTQSTPNAVTVRPPDLRAAGGVDTHHRNCLAYGDGVGTPVTAEFLNEISANLRALARLNGATGSGAAIVPDDNTDTMLARAVQNLLQRGRPNYAQDSSGAANAVVVTLIPAPPEIVTGMRLIIRAANANTGPVALTVNTFSGMAIVYPGGAALATAEVAAGGILDIIYNGTAWVLQSPKAVAAASFAVIPRVYTASGSWTKPAGLASIRARFAGGGGAGGVSGSFSLDTPAFFGGPGGPGGVVESWFTASALAATESFLIGAAGAVLTASTGGDDPGNPGGSSTFKGLIAGGGGAGLSSFTADGIPGAGGTCTVSGNAIAFNGLGCPKGMRGTGPTLLGAYGSGGSGGQRYASTGINGSTPGAGVLIIEEYYR